MEPKSEDYQYGYKMGYASFVAGNAKIFPGSPEASIDIYHGWHQGWHDAWVAMHEECGRLMENIHG